MEELEAKFASQLEELKKQGFIGNDNLLFALKKADGDVKVAAELLTKGKELEVKYEKELAELESRGFHRHHRNAWALAEVDGDIEAASESLAKTRELEAQDGKDWVEPASGFPAATADHAPPAVPAAAALPAAVAAPVLDDGYEDPIDISRFPGVLYGRYWDMGPFEAKYSRQLAELVREGHTNKRRILFLLDRLRGNVRAVSGLLAQWEELEFKYEKQLAELDRRGRRVRDYSIWALSQVDGDVEAADRLLCTPDRGWCVIC